MSLKKGNICLLVMTHRTHCPRSTRHEFGPNNVVSHLALPLSQVFFTKVFSTINDMPPSVGEVDHSCPCEGLIIHTFRAPPSSHDIVSRGHFLFLGIFSVFLGDRKAWVSAVELPDCFIWSGTSFVGLVSGSFVFALWVAGSVLVFLS